MLVLANKKSRGFKEKYRRKLLKLFSKRRKINIVYLPENKTNMYHNIDKKINGEQEIVIAGGDGSFESALNQPFFHHKSLGFFPLGSGNAFYSYFYKGKELDYLRLKFPFQQKEIDVLELEWEQGKIQTLFLSIGVDSEVMRLGKSRSNNGLLDYLNGCLKAIARGRSQYNLTITADQKKFCWKDCINLTFGKVPYYGYGVQSMITPIKKRDNFVYGIGCIKNGYSLPTTVLRLYSLFLTAFNRKEKPLFPLKAKEIVIKSQESFPLQAGGEYLGESNFAKIRVIRKQKVLMI